MHALLGNHESARTLAIKKAQGLTDKTELPAIGHPHGKLTTIPVVRQAQKTNSVVYRIRLKLSAGRNPGRVYAPTRTRKETTPPWEAYYENGDLSMDEQRLTR